MLQSLKQAIRDCYLEAERCAHNAIGTGDPKTAKDYRDMERRWLVLARSMEFTERLNSFIREDSKGRVSAITPKPDTERLPQLAASCRARASLRAPDVSDQHPTSANDVSPTRHRGLSAGTPSPSLPSAPGMGTSRMSKSEEYRHFAQACLEMARTAEDDKDRTALIHMADVWFRLAQRHGRG